MNSDWISLHIHRRGGMDHLLMGGVSPLIEHLRREGVLARWFFLRYWDGGPHLRLRLLPNSGHNAEEVLSAARRTMERWVAHNPSTVRLTTGEYAERARFLAAHERFERPPLPLRANDTIEEVLYRPETEVFGTGPALAAAEAHFEESSTLALAILERTRQDGQRARIAFFLLMIALSDNPCRPDVLVRWLRSSWEDWRAAAAVAQGELPPALNLRARGALLEQAEHLWAATRTQSSLNSEDLLGMWAHSLARLRWAHSGTPSGPSGRAASPFSPKGGPGPEGAPSLPLLLRCTHLLNNRTGLTGDAEGALFALACDALAKIAEKNGVRDG